MVFFHINPNINGANPSLCVCVCVDSASLSLSRLSQHTRTRPQENETFCGVFLSLIKAGPDMANIWNLHS